MVGTSISSVTFLAYPADSFKTSWLRFLPNLMLPVVIITTAYFFLPFFRRNNIISAYEYLEDRFGPSVRVYGAVTFFIGQLVRISLILYLLSLMVNEVTNLSVIQSILLAGFIVGLYTIIGGIEAEYLKGVGKLGDRLLILLDLDKILTSEEKQQLI